MLPDMFTLGYRIGVYLAVKFSIPPTYMGVVCIGQDIDMTNVTVN